MPFLLVKQDATNLKIAKAIKTREEEIAAYQFELDSHNDSLQALGLKDWDEKNSKYRGLPRDQMIARALADGLTHDEIQALGDLLSLDHHRVGVHAVKIEMAKATRIYNSLLASLPEGAERDAAFAAVQAEDAAQATTPTP